MVGICNKKKEKRERLYNSFDKKTVTSKLVHKIFKPWNKILSDYGDRWI